MVWCVLLDIQNVYLFMIRCHQLDDDFAVVIHLLAVICHWPTFHGSAIRNVWAYVGASCLLKQFIITALDYDDRSYILRILFSWHSK